VRHATSDWVIWVDADEELQEQTPGALRFLCAHESAPEHGFLVSCKNLSNEQGDISTVIRQWRLFRNHRGIEFKGRIHEHLVPSGGSVNANLIPQEVVWIRHWGYMPIPELMARKRSRNFPLLELAVKEKPDDPFVHYNLGKQYAAEHNFEPALKWLDKAIELWRATKEVPYAFVGSMFALAINSAVELGNNERALEIEAETPEAFRTADVLFQAGVAYSRVHRYEDALDRLNRAWQDPTVNAQTIEGDPSSSTWRPLGALAHLHMELDKPEEAYEFAKKAYEFAPTRPNILYALSFISARLKRLEESVKWARELIEGKLDEGFKAQGRRILFNVGIGTSQPILVVEALAGPVEGVSEEESVLFQARALKELGEEQGQYDALEAGCKRFPDHSGIRLALAEFLDAHGYLPEAAAILSAGLDQPQPPAELYQRLAIVLTKQGRLEDAAKALELSAHAADRQGEPDPALAVSN
jgi:tetratricopeptide (TPR) repeat protein